MTTPEPTEGLTVLTFPRPTKRATVTPFHETRSSGQKRPCGHWLTDAATLSARPGLKLWSRRPSSSGSPWDGRARQPWRDALQTERLTNLKAITYHTSTGYSVRKSSLVVSGRHRSAPALEVRQPAPSLPIGIVQDIWRRQLSVSMCQLLTMQAVFWPFFSLSATWAACMRGVEPP